MDEQYPQVLDLAGGAVRTGVDALIVADPGLIVRLREGGIDLPLHLSTLGLACNPQSVALYRDLGISRVILPRFLNLEQIASLIRKGPDMEYEAFVLVGRCPNIEGVCTFVHDSPDQRWPCEWPWKLTREDGKAVPPVLPTGLQRHFEGIRTSDRRDGCGLCALPRLVAAGVSTFKVVGRGAPLPRKVALVGQLSRLLAGLPDPPGREWVEDCLGTYRSLFGRGCRPHNCYFPEARDPE